LCHFWKLLISLWLQTNGVVGRFPSFQELVLLIPAGWVFLMMPELRIPLEIIGDCVNPNKSTNTENVIETTMFSIRIWLALTAVVNSNKKMNLAFAVEREKLLQKCT
jgi:hypothetical protein